MTCLNKDRKILKASCLTIEPWKILLFHLFLPAPTVFTYFLWAFIAFTIGNSFPAMTKLNCSANCTNFNISLFCFFFFSAQRITTIHLDGVQYFISRMNPYSPELNYFLAYQYCRSLGLQLASFETREKAESMTMYLKNAGYGNYDFWTSGNRLGTGMFLWMSTGLPFNATFDFFENSADAIQAGLLDPVDHNSNTAPQRTARDR